MTTKSVADPSLASRVRSADPSWQAFALLRTVFTVAPILFGLDKFFNLMVDWPGYLAPVVTDVVPIDAQQIMYAIGVIEIVAGIIVAIKPKVGSVIVALWLVGIIVNLLLIPDYFDVALRDFGLFVAAVALFRLSFAHDNGPRRDR